MLRRNKILLGIILSICLISLVLAIPMKDKLGKATLVCVHNCDVPDKPDLEIIDISSKDLNGSIKICGRMNNIQPCVMCGREEEEEICLDRLKNTAEAEFNRYYGEPIYAYEYKNSSLLKKYYKWKNKKWKEK